MTKRICVEAGCERPFYGRGWCQYHYNKAIKGGTLEARPREMVERGAGLDARLRHTGWTVTASGCWEFRGSKGTGGYGQIAVGNYADGRSTPEHAYRAAYMAWVGPIPDGGYICHSCDNPPCINPAHLFLGTSDTNIQDMVSKRRNSHGEREPLHKLSDSDIVEIRARYIAGGVSQKALAGEYGVSQQLVSMLTRGERRVEPTHWITA